MKNLSKIVLIATLVLAQSACMINRSGENLDAGDWTAASNSGKDLGYRISGNILLNGKPMDVNSIMLNKWKKNTEKSYEKSNLFTSISEETSEADVIAEIQLTDTGNTNQGLAFLSGFTLGVIPSFAEDKLHMKTTFKNAEGDILGTYETEETVSMVIQILLLPMIPTVGRMDATFQDLSSSILQSAEKDGIF